MKTIVFLLAATLPALAGDFNAIVLEQIAKQPSGGGYAVTREAHQALNKAVSSSGEGLKIDARLAQPSYCSGATYLVFLQTLQALEKRNLARDVPWKALIPRAARDGAGVWGRWNANGPGTARLFHESGLGRNFTDWKQARPGDFMKIFWTPAVGKLERGHLVVFLGVDNSPDGERVRFWSSNKPLGYGEKSVARKSVARAIFSRLENPQAASHLDKLPALDAYLAGLLENESSFDEACRLSGVRESN